MCGADVFMHVLAGNICAIRVPLILPQQRSHERGSSGCQHGASSTFWVLLKVLTEEKTERALSAGAQLCLGVLPAHSLFSPVSVQVCVFWQLGGDGEKG